MAERRFGWRMLMLLGEGIAFAGGLAVGLGAALPWAEFAVFRMPVVLPGILVGGALTVATAAGGLALLRRFPLLTVAFGLATLLQNLVDVREELPGQEAEDDDEGEQGDDKLGNRRDEGVFGLLGRQNEQLAHVSAFRLVGCRGSEDHLP